MKNKEPSLLRQIITIHYEQAKRRKALRLLEKQTWSIDFLVLLLQRAAKLTADNVQMTITNKEGKTITLSYDKDNIPEAVRQMDDSILNHLDDNAAVERFIREHSAR